MAWQYRHGWLCATRHPKAFPALLGRTDIDGAVGAQTLDQAMVERGQQVDVIVLALCDHPTVTLVRRSRVVR